MIYSFDTILTYAAVSAASITFFYFKNKLEKKELDELEQKVLIKKMAEREESRQKLFQKGIQTHIKTTCIRYAWRSCCRWDCCLRFLR